VIVGWTKLNNKKKETKMQRMPRLKKGEIVAKTSENLRFENLVKLSISPREQ
jgi:hypothetical protein